MSDQVAAPVLSLPKGGGAVRGLGETFQPNLFRGTCSFSVPIPLSPGRDGFAPTLALQYDSGQGNSPFGLGWQLSGANISRRTEKGLPSYDGSDIFLLSGAEELVETLVQDQGSGRWTAPSPRQAGPYDITTYRPRVDVQFSRIERWSIRSGAAAGETHWRVTTRDNVTSIYGKTASGRVSDPANPEHVFEWLLEETFDARGNHISYEYVRDIDQERGSCRSYLRRVLYANSHEAVGPLRTATSHTNPLATLARHYLIEVVLDYSVVDDPRSYSITDLASGWESRPDPFSSFRAGFEIRTRRRCHSVRVFHHFSELGAPTLVRRTALTYSSQPLSLLSILDAITSTGYADDDSGAHSLSMPPLSFTYSAFDTARRQYQPLEGAGGAIPALSLRNADVALVDVSGDGLPDFVFSSAQGMRLSRNRGGGAFDAPRDLPESRGIALSARAVALADADGDGRVDLLVHAGSLQGYFESSGDLAWSTFHRYPSLPSFALSDPSVRLLDLTGDGRADALMTRDDQFLWYRGAGQDGYQNGGSIPRIHDLAQFPDVQFNDPSNRVRLADMSGDGLSDIVLLHVGRVDYWPNLGYGRFGRRVTMGDVPDAPALRDGFDMSRYFVVDLDGSGCADLVYVDFDRVHFWLNQTGNGWSARQTIFGTPLTTSGTDVRFCDVFGTGAATILWSSDTELQSGRNYKALRFCAGTKPNLIEGMDNHLGTSVRVAYGSSVQHALRDARAGSPWATPLPIPVQVVECIETIDQLSQTKLVQSYTYHHGYYDGHEREFRGFGRVDSLDSETFDAFTTDGLHGALPFVNDQAAHFSQPVLTKSWFHTGAVLADARTLTQHFRTEFYAGDAAASPLEEPALDVPADVEREAYRALRGLLLRSETYTLDGSPRASHPHGVSEQSYDVRLLQPRASNVYASLMTVPREHVVYHYDRDPADRRIEHELTLLVDAYGNIQLRAGLAYPRRIDAGVDAQNHVSGTCRWARFINTPERAQPGAAQYRVGVLCETRTYELLALDGLAPPGRLISSPQLIAHCGDPRAFAPFGAPAGGMTKRILQWRRTHFRGDDEPDAIDEPSRFTHRLAFGFVQSLGLPYESYDAAFSPQLLTAVYGMRVQPDDCRRAGYLRSVEFDPNEAWPAGTEDYCWARQGRHAYEDPSTGFCQPITVQDAVGNRCEASYDRYRLLVLETRDPVRNVCQASYDYRVLKPVETVDPNGNRTKAAYDALGMIVGTAVLGKAGGAVEGDTLEGFRIHLSEDEISACLDDPTSLAGSLLANATSRTVYDVRRYQRSARPAAVLTVAREWHVSPPRTGPPLLNLALLYSDGYGRELQTKVRAEPPQGAPAAAVRWIATGTVVFDNKARPVRRYEPFFSTVPDYEPDVTDGESSTVFYDALGRAVATLAPDHTYQKTIVRPWGSEQWDANDTLALDPAGDPDVGDRFRALPPNDYLPTWYQTQANSADPAVRRAADAALVHADTPSRALFDVFGRVVMTLDDDGSRELTTSTTLDVEGNVLAIVDPRGVAVQTQQFDMLKRTLAGGGVDDGLRVSFPNVFGAPVYTWDARAVRSAHTYDALQRQTELRITDPGTGATHTRVQMQYGESAPNPEVANLRTRLHRVRDGSGEVVWDAYDFKGNASSFSRCLLAGFGHEPDWSSPVALDDDVFLASLTYDALDRIVERTEILRDLSGRRPDRRFVTSPAYNEGKLLSALSVRALDDAVPTAFVQRIDYGPRAERALIRYGNDVETRHEYDAMTCRLRGQTAQKGTSPPVQQLSYVYDAVGNIAEIADGAFATVFNGNARVDPATTFTYDALYRLIAASGREHESVGACSFRDAPDKQTQAIALRPQQPAENGRALRNYREQYLYDDSGNLRRISHTGGPTRTQEFTDGSNRLASSDAGCEGERSFALPYDGNGNIQALPHLSALVWNGENRLGRADTTLLSAGAIDRVWFSYDAQGRRSRKQIERGGIVVEETLYLGDLDVYRRFRGGEVIFERLTLHVSDGQRRIALVEMRTIDTDHSERNLPARRVRYQMGNHLGSAVLELDESGGTVSYEEFYPFGGTAYMAGWNAVDVNRKRYRYSGKERDDETGLYYYGARYYAPWLGRWMSADPIGVKGGANLYAFAANNPARFVDAGGLEPQQPAGSPSEPVADLQTGLEMLESRNAESRAKPENRGAASHEWSLAEKDGNFRIFEGPPDHVDVGNWNSWAHTHADGSPIGPEDIQHMMDRNLERGVINTGQGNWRVIRLTERNAEGELTGRGEFLEIKNGKVIAQGQLEIPQPGSGGHIRPEGQMSPTEGTANGTTNASGLVKYLSKNAGPAPGAPATAGGAPGSAAPPDAPSGGTWSRVKTYLSENKADIASKGLTTAFLGWIGWDIGKKTYDTTERLGTEAGQQQALKSTVQAEYGILWFELGLMTTGALLTGGVWAPIAVLYGATVVVYGTEQSNQMVNRASPGLQ